MVSKNTTMPSRMSAASRHSPDTTSASDSDALAVETSNFGVDVTFIHSTEVVAPLTDPTGHGVVANVDPARRCDVVDTAVASPERKSMVSTQKEGLKW